MGEGMSKPAARDRRLLREAHVAHEEGKREGVGKMLVLKLI